MWVVLGVRLALLQPLLIDIVYPIQELKVGGIFVEAYLFSKSRAIRVKKILMWHKLLFYIVWMEQVKGE